MRLEPSAEAVRLAEQRNAAAMRLLAKGKLREALDNLNDAIRIAPSYPRSYLNRAHVFERLGMSLPAEADRRRGQELARAAGYSLEEPSAAAPPTGPVADTGLAESGWSWWQHLWNSVWHLLQPGVVKVGVGLVALAGIAVGMVFGLGILDGRDSDGGSSSPSGAAAASGTPTALPTAAPTTMATPTPLGTATPILVTVGSPFSFIDVQKGWEGRNIAVTLGERSTGFSGFTAAPFDVSLVRGSDSMELSILVYGDRETAKVDWQLISGQAPVPKEGRVLPDHESVWWNRNIVVVVRSRSGDIGTDALSAFFALSP